MRGGIAGKPAAVTGLTVGKTVVAALPGRQIVIGPWGYVVALAQPDPTQAGALAVHLTKAHAGLPAGTVHPDRVRAARAVQGDAAEGRDRHATSRRRQRIPPRRRRRSSRRSTPGARSSVKPKKPKRHVRKHRLGDDPLTVTPPLGLTNYVFPVAGVSSYGDTYGGYRGDVPGQLAPRRRHLRGARHAGRRRRRRDAQPRRLAASRRVAPVGARPQPQPVLLRAPLGLLAARAALEVREEGRRDRLHRQHAATPSRHRRTCISRSIRTSCCASTTTARSTRRRTSTAGVTSPSRRRRCPCTRRSPPGAVRREASYIWRELLAARGLIDKSPKPSERPRIAVPHGDRRVVSRGAWPRRNGARLPDRVAARSD